MDDTAFSRRQFLKGGTAGILQTLLPLSTAVIAGACSARDNDADYTFLTPDVAADLRAIAARIFPTTETPGATEAGVVHFFDQAFGSDMRDSYALVRDGLAALNASIAEGRFANQDSATQDALLAGIERQPFFEFVRVMTIFGFFAMSRYGGNRDHVSWKLIGFDGHHGAWRPPFGYYDAQNHAAGNTADDS